MPIVIAVPIVALLVALVALLMIWSLKTFAQGTAPLLPDWHILGFGSIRSFWVNTAEGLYTVTLKALHTVLAPAGQFMLYPVIVFARLWSIGETFATEAVTTASWIIKTEIPRQILVLRNDVNHGIGLVNGAISAATGIAHQELVNAINTLGGQVSQSIQNLQGNINAVNNTLRAALATAIADTRSYAAGIVGDARDYALSLSNGVIQYANSLYNRAIAYADATAISAASAAVGVLETDTDHAVAAIWGEVTGATAGVVAVADGAFSDALSDWNALTRTIPTSIPGAIAAIGALAIPLIKLTEECTIPNCKNLSQVGRDLQSLFGLLEGVSFLTFLADVIEHPSSAAEEIAGELNDYVGAPARAFAGLVGL